MSEFERTELTKQILERMNLPPEFWRSKVTDIEDEETRKVVSRYLKKIDEMVSEGIGLLLYGVPGVGKTIIAALIAKEARTWKHTVFFTMIWELRECVRSRVPSARNTARYSSVIGRRRSA